MLRGVAYGNLYLTEKAGGADFDRRGRGARRRCSPPRRRWRSRTPASTRRRRAGSSQLEALNEIGNALLRRSTLPRLLDLIARRLRELIDARLVAIALPRAGRHRSIIEAADGERAEEIRGARARATGSKSGRVLERRRERAGRLAARRSRGRLRCRPRRWAPAAALCAAASSATSAIGVIVAHDKAGADPRFSDDDLRLAEAFAIARRRRRRPLAPRRRRRVAPRRRGAGARAARGSRASCTTRPARR